VRRWLGILLLLLTVAPLPAQQKTPATDGGMEIESLEDLVTQNFDPDVLRALSQLDEDKVRKLFSELQQAMSGTNIYQLGTLRDTAKQLIPLLQKYEETSSLGDWLQTRLDYLQAAQELERAMKAAEPKSAGARSLPAPSLKMEREVWKRALDKRPWPPQAPSYVPQLKAAFLEERAPPELVWVAEVESSFNPDARSPAGAAGMFQLMPQAARDEQLSLSPRDERLQPEKSARAAARRLRALHTRYGDWQLALAAYNAGEGRVDRLLEQQKAHTFEAISRRLPAETQMYVPKVEATVREREGRELKDLRAHRRHSNICLSWRSRWRRSA
jgi:membrane-bound lytic murein transglycosylase D